MNTYRYFGRPPDFPAVSISLSSLSIIANSRHHASEKMTARAHAVIGRPAARAPIAQGGQFQRSTRSAAVTFAKAARSACPIRTGTPRQARPDLGASEPSDAPARGTARLSPRSNCDGCGRSARTPAYAGAGLTAGALIRRKNADRGAVLVQINDCERFSRWVSVLRNASLSHHLIKVVDLVYYI